MLGYPHQYLASATGGTEGSVVVSGEGLPPIDTQSPPQFGGPEGVWSPETMLSATVANCFILTFRAIARASKFDWTALDCNVEGVLDRPERTTLFTAFNVHAVLRVPSDEKLEMAQRLLEKAEHVCLITASLKSEIILTTDIKVG
ncbi:MAG: OsmC family protein [Xanthomonadales bacterium]|nr:OsmC family protein [Gammaproteobacteria bacterium]MBT8072072.1 OsmC family protein [Gammaproteobacteria bacterium]MBT8075670.1 OsmC family protein [Gammaproteobacteria bacterium]NNK02913.1 OsmC family protein [Xanthomonadales bacterium]NNK98406.1 OsmC family protein [Xanthomonadales bacterium]